MDDHIQPNKTDDMTMRLESNDICNKSAAASETPASPYSCVVVVGLGLIGASISGAIRATWSDVRICGVDKDADTRQEALRRLLVDDAYDATQESFACALEGADLVILAVPVDASIEYMQALAAYDFSGVVTDTASTKTRICEIASHELPYLDNYIPGHPMAGSEQNGIQGSRSDLFQGAYWIICPDSNTRPDHIPHLHEFIVGLGARPIVIPRENHDNVVAVVSHVPHLVASSLVELAARASDEQKSVLRLAAGGFKDTTRIASGSADLWCGISFDNARAIQEGLIEMKDILDSYITALSSGDRNTMKTLLADAAEVRKSLPAAWVPSSEKLLEVRIPMANHPGAVAEATAIAGEAGCNIQSIEIDHVTEDRAYLSMILTDEGDVGSLSVKLIEAGYAVTFAPVGPKEHVFTD